MTGTSQTRLVGLDVARCLALLGMVATHVLDERTPQGTSPGAVAGRRPRLRALRRARRCQPGADDPRAPARTTAALRTLGIAGRALLIGALGLLLGALDTGIAIILTYYAVLFVLGLPFTFLGVRCARAARRRWVVVGAGGLAPGPPRPARARLREPGPRPAGRPPAAGQRAAADRLLPGRPVAGLPARRARARRLDLRDRSLLGAVGLGGLGTAVLATQISRTLVDPAVASENATGMYGTTPPDGDWSWLLLVAPHSATPFDLAQTIGSAVLVIACCLLLERLLPRPATTVLAVVFGAGAATLTLYSLHVVMRTTACGHPRSRRRTSPTSWCCSPRARPSGCCGSAGPLETVAGLPVRLARRAAPGQRSGTNR